MVSRPHRGALGAALMLVASLLGVRLSAQSTENEWWPELDVYWTEPSRQFRIFALSQMAKAIEDQSRTLTLGLHLDYLPLAWGSMRVGFRTLRSLDDQGKPEDRALAEVVLPKTGGAVRFRARTRLELRWIAGEPSQRWRERFQLERESRWLWKRRFILYATDELYWDSRYHALSRNAYRLGGIQSVSDALAVDLSVARQDNRFGSPRHVNALWLRVELSYGDR